MQVNSLHASIEQRRAGVGIAEGRRPKATWPSASSRRNSPKTIRTSSNQERDIARLQQANAEATVEFLARKFTNVELYDWMSGVLRQVYSYFLQQATAVARLAQAQLAFERQDVAPAFIQARLLAAAALTVTAQSSPTVTA